MEIILTKRNKLSFPTLMKHWECMTEKRHTVSKGLSLWYFWKEGSSPREKKKFCFKLPYTNVYKYYLSPWSLYIL